MSWYQKLKPADQVVPPGKCVICGRTGWMQLTGPIVPEAHTATPRSRWICRKCADERRGDAASN